MLRNGLNRTMSEAGFVRVARCATTKSDAAAASYLVDVCGRSITTCSHPTTLLSKPRSSVPIKYLYSIGSKRYLHHRAATGATNGNVTLLRISRHGLLPTASCAKEPLTKSFSTAASEITHPIDSTPLGGPEGAALLQGLDIHTVPAEDDDHPLTVYTISDREEAPVDASSHEQRTPILLLHGRTWGSVPVYHLMGGRSKSSQSPLASSISSSTETSEGESRSLMEALYATNNVQPYALDFRGFGGTPKDDSGFVEPLRCVLDVVSVLNWIHGRSDESNNETEDKSIGMEGESGKEMKEKQTKIKPALLGWSHGALIAQLVAQRHPEVLSKLILYGSIYNPNIKYPKSPPLPITDEEAYKGHTDHDDFPLFEEGLAAIRNEYDGAMEDFTNIPAIPARLFAEAALISDPIKVQWWNVHQLNECHPSLVRVPTMVIAGDQDPYAPLMSQVELFTNLGRGVDRNWSIIANTDHAAHLSDERCRFVEHVKNFLEMRL